jgi:hypothetical protein
VEACSFKLGPRDNHDIGTSKEGISPLSVFCFRTLRIKYLKRLWAKKYLIEQLNSKDASGSKTEKQLLVSQEKKGLLWKISA